MRTIYNACGIEHEFVIEASSFKKRLAYNPSAIIATNFGQLEHSSSASVPKSLILSIIFAIYPDIQ